MPTDLPPDYKPKPAPGDDIGRPRDPGAPPAPPGADSPTPPGEGPKPVDPDVASPIPGTVPAPTGLPTF